MKTIFFFSIFLLCIQNKLCDKSSNYSFFSFIFHEFDFFFKLIIACSLSIFLWVVILKSISKCNTFINARKKHVFLFENITNYCCCSSVLISNTRHNTQKRKWNSRHNSNFFLYFFLLIFIFIWNHFFLRFNFSVF